MARQCRARFAQNQGRAGMTNRKPFNYNGGMSGRGRGRYAAVPRGTTEISVRS
jgi:hypothetical protein